MSLLDFELDLSKTLTNLEELLSEGEALRIAILEQEPSYDTVVLGLARFHHRLNIFWSPVAHLNAVKNTAALRAVYDAGVIKLTEYQVKLAQDEKLYQVYQQLAESKDFAHWDESRQRVVKNALRDFKLAGIGLSPENKKLYQNIQTKLSAATSQFEHHLMDATDAWSYHTIDFTELKGLPPMVVEIAAQKARQNSLEGYSFGLDAATYSVIISHAENRALRQHFYQAYTTRASDLGEAVFDNSSLMVDILRLRAEEAALLGFSNFATVSLATKMAATEMRVLTFLRDLAKRSQPKARAELTEIQQFAKQKNISYELEAWDLAYFSECMKEERFGFSDEELRPYFPLSRTLSGLFKLLEQVFAIQLKSCIAPVWNESVQYFEVYNEKKQLCGAIYMDFFARPQKRGGAWMDDARGRFYNGDVQDFPIAYLTCNFLKGEHGHEPCLLHDEIVTLFHEMGHVLQHVLTVVNEPDVAGISGIPWDAVELPSQFLENFAWQKEVLQNLSAHVETGQSLPDDLIARLQKSQTFQGALQMLRQVEFALFDFMLHQQKAPEKADEIQALLKAVRQEIAVIHVPSYNRFQHGFSHIFAGGYAAGYYSYKWAEVLSADAFSRFEEEGIFNPIVGQAFRKTILESGGARDAMALFVEFRGREPAIDALLKLSGTV